LTVFAIGGFVLLHESAFAQTMTVDPISVTLEHSARSAAISLSNTGDQPIPIQARPFLWAQVGGKDVLTPTQDVIISPPLATVPEGQTQVLRLLVRHPPTNKEASYRILIDELPLPGSDPHDAGVVHVVFRLSIPVFYEPGMPVAPELSWRVLRSGSGASLEVTNSGSQHSKFFNPILTTAGGATIKIAQDGTPYVLASATRRWRVGNPGALPAGDSTLRATASGNEGPIIASVPVIEAP
jgi:fimbrial chaperone protein